MTLNELLWKYEASGLQEADYDRQDGVIGYAWVARYTREFLDAYLKHDAPAQQFLKNTPADNGVPKHVLAVNFQPAKSMPPSFTSLRVEVARQGFDHVADVYATFQKDQSNFKLDADDVVAWAYELLADNHVPEAIDVMKLAVQLNPSSRAYSSLGEMYTKAGQKQAAIDSYKTALEKDSNNIIATQGLKEVESGASEK